MANDYQSALDNLRRMYDAGLLKEPEMKNILSGMFAPKIIPSPPIPPGLVIQPPSAVQYTGGMHTGLGGQYSTEALLRMLAMRMRWDTGASTGLEFISAHKGNELVFIFIVREGQPMILEDDTNMFPSDALVTKLRLMVG